jgi:hypothetical protein
MGIHSTSPARGRRSVAGSPVALASVTLCTLLLLASISIADEGSLARNALTQSDGRFALKARLTTQADARAVLSEQTSDRFSLIALLSSSSLICYNDTIFLDDFDGDGFF